MTTHDERVAIARLMDLPSFVLGPWRRDDTLRISLPGIPARLYRVTDIAPDGTLSLRPVDGVEREDGEARDC